MRIDARPMPLQAPAAPDAARVDKVARDMEGLFAQMMIRAMREATPDDASFPGAAGQFRDLYDQKLAEAMTRGRGLGLAPMIARQIEQQQAPTPSPGATGAPLPLRPGAVPKAVGDARPAMLPLNEYPRPLAARPAELAARSGATPLPMAAPRGVEAARRDWIPAEAVTRLQAAVERRATVAAEPPAPVRTNRAAANRAEAFVEKVWPHAQRVARELGVDPRAIVAQAALETGWGRSTIRGEGGTANNYFGIKAGSRWRGDTVQTATQEYAGGGFRTERAEFRAYDDVGASFDDYAALVGRSARYAGAVGAGEDIRGFAQALQRAGYATDPAYARKIEAIATGPTLERALGRLEVDDARGPSAGATLFAASLGGL
ncbi:MAG: flagellar assembly peptidoglycan hydrolase FlgJ [Lysobacteraceae bacterium]